MSEFITKARNGELGELIALMHDTRNSINKAIDALQSTVVFDDTVIENRCEAALEMCQELETQISEEMCHSNISDFLDMLADDIDDINIQEAGDTTMVSDGGDLIMEIVKNRTRTPMPDNIKMKDMKLVFDDLEKHIRELFLLEETKDEDEKTED